MARKEDLDYVITKRGLPEVGKSRGLQTSEWFKGVKNGGDIWYFVHEWYVPESHDDDDDSLTGFLLPHRPGLARRRAVYKASTLDDLRDMLDD